VRSVITKVVVVV